ncbi:hypothetical protein D9758_004671 [Tetrapyrgos nigripes]|uniref:Uncharacterized protein n=1 Tax=Tetrapyrgos nigripes TaxID=182062 RepID=A0A8H5LYM2_9AGAR|nr:hypothetical protein D9758_004671 [Tetrapyrgos nigripes]
MGAAHLPLPSSVSNASPDTDTTLYLPPSQYFLSCLTFTSSSSVNDNASTTTIAIPKPPTCTITLFRGYITSTSIPITSFLPISSSSGRFAGFCRMCTIIEEHSLKVDLQLHRPESEPKVGLGARWLDISQWRDVYSAGLPRSDGEADRC